MRKTDELYNMMKESPHVVLLGAGASCACISNGDKNGQKISVMDNFFENTGIDIGYTGALKNLEDIYQDIDDSKKTVLENEVSKYFDKFILPDEPTIYDILIISLTRKDLIASFNWDPLLIQACQRCSKYTKDIPEIVFLHGNVWEWYAVDINGNMTAVFAPSEHPPGAFIKTSSGQKCTPTPLLFPVKNKNYSDNNYIRKSWEIFHDKLSKSFMLTIFGYSGPKSDEEALALLKSGFLVKENNGDTSDINNFKQLTIIDINVNDDKEKKIYESFKGLLDVQQSPFVEGIKDYFEILDGFWNEKNWLISWPRLTTDGYVATQYEVKFPPKKLMTVNNQNLNWDFIESIIKNQIKKEEL